MRRPQGRVGSSPTLATTIYMKLPNNTRVRDLISGWRIGVVVNSELYCGQFFGVKWDGEEMESTRLIEEVEVISTTED